MQYCIHVGAIIFAVQEMHTLWVLFLLMPRKAFELVRHTMGQTRTRGFASMSTFRLGNVPDERETHKTPESHRPVQTSARREIVHIFRGLPPAQRRVRLSPIESFVLNAATAADEQRRPRKINSCFYKTPESHRPVQTSARREIVHIFRVYPPAQRRVRLSPIESFVLNAATAADEQRRPRKINSCFYN